MATTMPAIAQNSVVFSESFVSSNVRPPTSTGVLARARSLVSTVAIVAPPFEVYGARTETDPRATSWCDKGRTRRHRSKPCVERPFCLILSYPQRAKPSQPLFLFTNGFAGAGSGLLHRRISHTPRPSKRTRLSGQTVLYM